MIEFEGFEWDEGNLSHATRHGVTREEIEEALVGGVVEVAKYLRRGEERYTVVARSPHTGALLEMAVTERGKRLRVITAHVMKRGKRGRYEKEI
jgi:uncharacterized DUF497 family protein